MTLTGVQAAHRTKTAAPSVLSCPQDKSSLAHTPRYSWSW